MGGTIGPWWARVKSAGCGRLGKVQFFASLSPQEKLKVLSLTDIPDVWSRFQGDAQHEGKTEFFATLSEEVKANALNTFSKASCSLARGLSFSSSVVGEDV